MIDIESLYRTQRKRITRFAMRMVRDQEDAADVVQTAFLEAHRCRASYSGACQPATWVYAIVRNCAMRHIKAKVRRQCVDVDESVLEQLIDERADPQRQVEARELVARVDARLSKIGNKACEAFESVLDGMSYEETAIRLGIPIGTVRSRVSRIRGKVQEAAR